MDPNQHLNQKKNQKQKPECSVLVKRVLGKKSREEGLNRNRFNKQYMNKEQINETVYVLPGIQTAC